MPSSRLRRRSVRSPSEFAAASRGRSLMPIYEFRCRQCRKRTTALVLVRDRVSEVRCKHCGSSDLTKLVSRFATPRSEEARLDRLTEPTEMAGVDESDPKSVARWMRKMGREMGEDFEEDVDRAIEEDMSGGDDTPGGEDTPDSGDDL